MGEIVKDAIQFVQANWVPLLAVGLILAVIVGARKGGNKNRAR